MNTTKILKLGKQEKTVQCVQHRPYEISVDLIIDFLHDCGAGRGKSVSASTKEIQNHIGCSQVNTNILLNRMVEHGYLIRLFYHDSNSYFYAVKPQRR